MRLFVLMFADTLFLLPWDRIALLLIPPLWVFFINEHKHPPFVYPYFEHEINVTDLQDPYLPDLVDQYLLEHGLEEINRHHARVQRWKERCQTRIRKSILKNYRRGQYVQAVDDPNEFVFYLVRKVQVDDIDEEDTHE